MPEENQSEEKLELTPEQKTAILELWNSSERKPPTLRDLIQVAFKKDLDPRSSQGRIIRKFLAERKLKFTFSNEYQKKERFQFTQEQKDEIIKLAGLYRPYEIARKIFNDPELEPATVKVRSVIEFLDELPSNLKKGGESNNNSEEDYVPPQSIPKLVIKVNEYANPEKKIESNKLTPREKKYLNSCLGYLNNKRLIFQASSYQTENERILFESTFIKYVYDKPDLTQEEVDQYIMLATDAVISYNAQRTQSMLQKEQNDLVANGERMSMTLIEAIGDSKKAYDDSVARQRKLYDALMEKRSERISKQIKENASILNLVTLWKEEESRKEMIRYQQMKKQALKEEIKNYMSWGEQKLKILGISENEILEN